MANTKSAEKRNRQNQQRRQRNRAGRSRMRNEVKKLRGAVESGDAERAKGLLEPTLALIDRSVQKGVIHRNTAARTKSRLAKAVHGLDAQ